jgi:hypothetical protein
MLVSQIIAETRQLIQQVTESNSAITDSGILAYINECTLQLCSYFSTLPKTAISGVTAAATLTLDDNLLKLDHASIYDGSTYYPLGTTDFVNFTRENPMWENTPAGKPVMLIRMTDLTWKMYPAPDATWTGKTVSIYGSVLPADLTLTTEAPPVSLAMHPAYPHYCAWKAWMVLNDPVKASQEYAIFDSIRKINTMTATTTRGSLLSLRME